MYLSHKHQELLVSMFGREVTSMNNGVYSSDAFYRATSFLKGNDLIYSKRRYDNTHEYFLTIKGEILARILMGVV